MLIDYEPDWSDIIAHYEYRVDLSHRIRQLVFDESDDAVDFCLGIAEPQANYSASEHSLGSRVLSGNVNAKARVMRLARQLCGVKNSAELSKSIREANLNWLKISIGSEISMMLDPDSCWVANVRTIWAHLLIKHDWNKSWANEELRLYRDGDETSEMAYAKWTAIHKSMKENMLQLAELASEGAITQGFVPGEHKFIWADAVANWLYENS